MNDNDNPDVLRGTLVGVAMQRDDALTALTRIYNSYCPGHGDCPGDTQLGPRQCVHVIAGIALGVEGLGSEKAPEQLADGTQYAEGFAAGKLFAELEREGRDA